jgi:hypothetical protein
MLYNEAILQRRRSSKKGGKIGKAKIIAKVCAAHDLRAEAQTHNKNLARTLVPCLLAI